MGTVDGAGADAAAPLPDAVAARPGSGALRPASSADALAAARGAARAATARRGTRGTEQVVHVQIGRLEVSAAAPGTGAGRQERAPARRAATVSLEDYLQHGHGGDGRR
jgi:hypothetical protein